MTTRTSPADEIHIALLIDADNCPASKIEVILDELAKYGVTNIRRAYGNWKSTGLKGWEQVLHEYAIQPIQQFAYTKGKNATDSAMIIDAMDLLYGHKLDAFCLASSDSDFTPRRVGRAGRRRLAHRQPDFLRSAQLRLSQAE